MAQNVIFDQVPIHERQKDNRGLRCEEENDVQSKEVDKSLQKSQSRAIPSTIARLRNRVTNVTFEW